MCMIMRTIGPCTFIFNLKKMKICAADNILEFAFADASVLLSFHSIEPCAWIITKYKISNMNCQFHLSIPGTV